MTDIPLQELHHLAWRQGISLTDEQAEQILALDQQFAAARFPGFAGALLHLVATWNAEQAPDDLQAQLDSLS